MTSEAALREVRNRMDLALQCTPDAISISDAEGSFLQFNEAFATFHRFASKDECAKTLAEYPAFLEVCDASGTPVPLEMWAVPPTGSILSQLNQSDCQQHPAPRRARSRTARN
jgi:PAS domain-containing protein